MRALGSPGCQPAGLGSLPRPGKFAVSEKLHVQRCCRQGWRQLLASSLCSPVIRKTRALPQTRHYRAPSGLVLANNQLNASFKSASATPSIGSL
jgi:hypothetical protein